MTGLGFRRSRYVLRCIPFACCGSIEAHWRILFLPHLNFVLQSVTLRHKVHAMPTSTEAEEHLRVIRSLMEKATIYRAISAPTALIGGLASMSFGTWFYFAHRSIPAGAEADAYSRSFLVGWLAVLVVTSVANFWLIWRAAARRAEQFISAAMRKALWALLPPMLCGAFFTVVISHSPSHPEITSLPPYWMVFYGLGLLATAQFSPRSISLLGWCFLFAGFACFGIHGWLEGAQYMVQGKAHHLAAANWMMLATFGLFHLIYAGCTWPRGNVAGDV